MFAMAEFKSVNNATHLQQRLTLDMTKNYVYQIATQIHTLIQMILLQQMKNVLFVMKVCPAVKLAQTQLNAQCVVIKNI